MATSIPYLDRADGRVTLVVDGKPFLGLGGELHNSSGSSLEYMDSAVWPPLRKLGGTLYLSPVYWECLEPQPGVFDFTLVDGVIEQARREGVRLGLLWFGVWKNGNSAYAPAWLKKDERFFYMRTLEGRIIESVSPFCSLAIQRDTIAFTRLMEHVREFDGGQNTVVMVQIENEMGIWGGQPRDFCPEANAAYAAPLPAPLAEKYGADTWRGAFGDDAAEYFMVWAFATAVEKITSAGKAAYPIPMFCNTVVLSTGPNAKGHPSGAPVPKTHNLWRMGAPSIDFFSPDIYGANFRDICDDFVAAGNPLFIPELSASPDAMSKLFYAVGAHDALGFCPFGIEGMFAPPAEADLLSTMNIGGGMPFRPQSGEGLAAAYRMVFLLWEDIRKAHREGRICAFLQQNDMRAELSLGGYAIQVGFTAMPGGRPGGPFGGGPVGVPKREGAPVSGGFIMQLEKDRFLACGVDFSLDFRPETGEDGTVFILDKREVTVTENGLVYGRILNGDERNFQNVGSMPTAIEISLYRRHK